MPRRKIDHTAIAKVVISKKSTDHLKKIRKFLLVLQEYKKATKLYTTYINGVRKAIANNGKNIIYVSYKPDGTATGRFSNSGYSAGRNGKMGVSFHTLSRENNIAGHDINIRTMFIAPKGYKFITSDYSGMELRVAAHLSQDRRMIQSLNDGTFGHSYTASLVFNKDMEEITPLERQIAKSISFLVLYGGGARKLARDTGLTLARADAIIEKYQSIFPNLFLWMESVREELREFGYVTTPFGRRRRLPNIFSRDEYVRYRAERQAINFKVQSTSSDILAMSAIDTQIAFDREGLDASLVAVVHDSEENYGNEEQVEETVEVIEDIMKNYPSVQEHFGLKLDVPLEVDTHVGDSFE